MFKNFQGRRKIFKDNKIFFKDQGKASFDSKYKESPWASRTSGNQTWGNRNRLQSITVFWV